MRIASVGRAFPAHYHGQEDLIGALRGLWAQRYFNPGRLEALHRHVRVGGRHTALALEDYPGLDFTRANAAFLREGAALGEAALWEALDRAGLAPPDLDHLFSTTVTGVAVPSLDARLMNRMPLRPDLKRTPLFGLGCLAGAAGVARTADYLRAFPGHTAALLSVELCSLTFQQEDLSVPNLVGTGLFGDGAAAVVMVGSARPCEGPEVLASRSVFYPDTEEAMGWEVGASGFRLVLSAEVPDLVKANLRRDVEAFLGAQGLRLREVDTWICHPGGPKVLEAVEAALELPDQALALSWAHLEAVGNLSSASVLMVLRDTLARRPAAGSFGLMLAMGPGFAAELVLLRW